MASSETTFHVGQVFDSYEVLIEQLKSYQKENYMQLFKRSSRTVTGYLTKHPKRNLNKNLLFCELDYSCIHGGKKFKSKSSGARPNQR